MADGFRDIPEFTNLQTGRGLVRIPMEQDVPFTDRVRAIVDTAEFQRLRHITQLGLAAQVYPGATHTRFEHALGVFHNALQYLRQLDRDERFRRIVDPHHAEVLLVAALLHDLGHWPFCHPIEDMDLPDLPPHEEFAAAFLEDGRELATVLRRDWKIEPDEVLDVLVPRSDSEPLRLLRSILSGPIDIDKMDYLDRDSLHAGVPYGRNFDRSRLMQALLINETGDGLALSVKGKTAAELMVFARYVMFSEVYWHHAVRSATSMFAHAFSLLSDRFELRTLFRLSEPQMIAEMRDAARDTPVEVLLEGIFGVRRSLYKRVFELSLDQDRDTYLRLARRPFAQLEACSRLLAARLSARGSSVEPHEILIDAPPPHREVEFDVQIYYPKEDTYRRLDRVSPVVAALARTQFDDYVKRVRVFAHPRLAVRLSQDPRFSDELLAAMGDVSTAG